LTGHIYYILSGNHKERGVGFEYKPRGMVNGYISNVDEIICGICGQIAHQPLPTGLWIHGNNADFVNESDHDIRKADLNESILLLNFDEKNRYSEVEYYEFQGKTTSSEREHRHYECLIHRKYWCKLVGLDFRRNRLVGSLVDNYEQVEPMYVRKMSGNKSLQKSIDDFLFHSERRNARKFVDFLKAENVVMMKNPSEPVLFLEFYITKGRGWKSERIKIKEIKKTDFEGKLEVGEIVTHEKIKYEINQITGIASLSDSKSMITVYLKRFGRVKN